MAAISHVTMLCQTLFSFCMRPLFRTSDTIFTNIVSACICDASSKECMNEPEIKTQNSMVDICFSPASNDVVIDNIQNMELYEARSQLKYNIIHNGNIVSSLTSTEGYGSKKALVSTRLISIFFSNLSGNESNIIEVRGTASLAFGSSSGRKRLLQDDSRRGEKSEKLEDAGISGFALDFEIAANIGWEKEKISGTESMNDRSVVYSTVARIAFVTFLVMKGIEVFV